MGAGRRTIAKKSVKLTGGNEVTVAVTGNMLDMTPADLEVVKRIMHALEGASVVVQES